MPALWSVFVFMDIKTKKLLIISIIPVLIGALGLFIQEYSFLYIPVLLAIQCQLIITVNKELKGLFRPLFIVFVVLITLALIRIYYLGI